MVRSIRRNPLWSSWYVSLLISDTFGVRNISRSPLWGPWSISSLMSYNFDEECKLKSSVLHYSVATVIYERISYILVYISIDSQIYSYTSHKEYELKSSVGLLLYFLRDLIHFHWRKWAEVPCGAPGLVSLLISCTFYREYKLKSSVLPYSPSTMASGQ